MRESELVKSSGRIGGPRPAQGDRRQGNMLVLTLAISLLIVLLLAAAVIGTNATARHSQHALDHTGAVGLAEGVTEVAQKTLLDAFANFQTPSMSSNATFGGYTYPYQVTPIGAAVNRTDADGISQSVQTYRVDATVTQGQALSTITRVVDLTMTPIFQYMIFYENDLEVLPGPSMTLSGRVHSNADMYLSCGSTLTVDTNYLRATGEILRRRKNDGSEGTGTVSIKVNGGSTYENMANNEDSEETNWVSIANTQWNGTVQDGDHGVKEVAAPKIGTIQAFDPIDPAQKGYYHANAGLVVVNGNAFDNAGNPIILPAGTVTEKTMYDAREGKAVTVTEINMGLLNGSGQFPANGLLYAYRTDASASQPNGIRLTNGAEIRQPLSVVSQNPVYIKGDFNTVNKKGAAVMSDAVNLLSNGWNDTKTAGSLPVASNTTYNVAVVTGNVPTPDGGGNYSGGFENLPRFHENWSGRTATIRGAFINIFESQFAKSPWVYGGDRYTAPTRNWQYDTALNDISNMPPFTPNAVYFQRVLWDDNLPNPLP